MKKQLGIVFSGGQGPAPHILRQVLGGITPAPLLAAADSGLILAESAGFKPDWIIGDMDSLDDKNRLRSYPPERVIQHDCQKDYTDTELALALLREKGCDDAWIAGGGGGRLDHLLGIRDLFEREHFPRRWITAAEDIYCIDSAENNSLTVSLAPGSIVSVFLTGEGAWKAESRGLQWPLNKVHWKRGLYGLSNVALGDTMVINVIQGRFLVILELNNLSQLINRQV